MPCHWVALGTGTPLFTFRIFILGNTSTGKKIVFFFHQLLLSLTTSTTYFHQLHTSTNYFHQPSTNYIFQLLWLIWYHSHMGSSVCQCHVCLILKVKDFLNYMSVVYDRNRRMESSITATCFLSPRKLPVSQYDFSHSHFLSVFLTLIFWTLGHNSVTMTCCINFLNMLTTIISRPNSSKTIKR